MAALATHLTTCSDPSDELSSLLLETFLRLAAAVFALAESVVVELNFISTQMYCLKSFFSVSFVVVFVVVVVFV